MLVKVSRYLVTRELNMLQYTILKKNFPVNSGEALIQPIDIYGVDIFFFFFL